MSTLDDTALVSAFVAGDASAFDEICHRYRPLCYGIALNWLRNAQDADEVANDVMIRAHRGLGRFRGECSLKTWLHGITVRTAVNRHHYWRRRRRHLSDSISAPIGAGTTETMEDLLPCGEPDAPTAIELEELASEIQTALPKLRPKHRDILVLRAIQHRTYEEIGVELGLGMGTVKSRTARARECLRSALPEEILA